MAAPYNDLQSKAETAAASVVTDLAISGLTVNKGRTVDELATPYCVCMATATSPEVIRATGIFRVSIAVHVGSSADDLTTEADHRARVAEVFDAFLNDEIHTTLSAALADFYVYDVEQNGMESTMEERKWVDILNVDLVCCASDIS